MKNSIGDIYRLELIRNNNDSGYMHFLESDNVYFMMDYFDFLEERKMCGDDTGYIELCDNNRFDDIEVTENANDNVSVSKTSLALYELLRENEKPQEPFEIESVSDMPFICIVQVYMSEYQGEGRNISIDEIDEILMSYKKQLSDKINEKFSDNGIFSIYQTLHSEDFCIVIRSNQIQKIYEAIVGVMGIKTSFGQRLFFTYSNIGIACCSKGKMSDEGVPGEFLNLSPAVIAANKEVRFSVRFKVEASVVQKVREIATKTQKAYLEKINGVFGRYDLVIRMNISEFVQLYPYLCRDKQGYFTEQRKGKKIDNRFINEQIEGISGEPSKVEFITDEKYVLIKEIVEEIIRGNIRTLNSRILVNLEEEPDSGTRTGINKTVGNQIVEEKESWSNVKTEKITQEREALMKMYRDFQDKYGNRFLLKRRWHGELKHMLERLIHSYENLAYEVDSHANWYICSQYLRNLFENMNYYMEHTSENDEKAVRAFLENFQSFINAFEKYTHLLHGMNQHTAQAPHYHVVASIDGQKFLIAYEEYITYIHEAYRQKNWDEVNVSNVCREKRSKVRMLVYPDTSLYKVDMKPILYCDVVKKGKRDDAEITNLSLCRVPMFEYFMRPYDLIPLLTHEIGHQMLILNRTARNQFLITNIMRAIGCEFAYQVQILGKTEERSVTYDLMGEMLCRHFAEAMEKAYKEKNPEWEQYVLIHLPASIMDFMKELVGHSSYNSIEGRYGIGTLNWDEVMNDFAQIINEISIESFTDGNIEKYKQKRENLLERLAAIDCLARKQDIDQEDLKKRIMVLCDELLNMVNENYVLLGTYRIRQGELMNKKVSELEETFLEHAELIEKNMETVESDLPELLKTSKIKQYLELISRLCFLKKNACEAEIGKNDGKLTEIMKNVAKEVKEDFEGKLVNGNQYMVYDREKREKASNLEINNVEQSLKNYIKVFKKLKNEKINDLVDGEQQLYKEVCADLVMCHYLGFTAFGYFRMSISLAGDLNSYQITKKEEFSKRRLMEVLSVLLVNEGAEVNKKSMRSSGEEVFLIQVSALGKQIKCCVNKELNKAKENIRKEIERRYIDGDEQKELQFENLEKFFEIWYEQIRLMQDAINNDMAITWNGTICAELCKDDSPMFPTKEVRLLYRREINMFRKVYQFLEAWSELVKRAEITVDSITGERKEWFRINTSYWEHINSVYKNSMKPEKLHEVVTRVVNYYNSTDCLKNDRTNYEKMKDMLQFTQDFYYYNRFRCQREEENANE